jgi:hypothetical protein
VDILTPQIIDKLLSMPVLLVVLYVLWNNNKTTNRMLDIIQEMKKKEV